MAGLVNLLNSSELVKKAYDFAQKAHFGQKRMSGEPYFNHCKKVAEIIADWKLDEVSVAAALLHDVLEDTSVTKEQLRDKFGAEIFFLVDGVSKLGLFRYRGVKANVENIKKFILAVSKDLRVILIKLADRLHNIQTLKALPPQKQKRVALETMDIYSPLAYRLGMFNLAGELDDLSFPYVYPAEHRWLKEKVSEHYAIREKYAQRTKPLFQAELIKDKVNVVEIISRAKRYASLYRKLLKYEMNMDRIYDLVAIRCIVKTVEDCYAALGAIHQNWLPLPGRIKDYIAMPKENGYRSLHTTIFGPEEKIVEIQIRTPEMHAEAENGIAAHWAYQQAKEKKAYREGRATLANSNDPLLVRQLRDWQQNLSDSGEFMRSFKINFLEHRILALTPKGKVVNLPKKSTPIDFAYQIHSEVGNACVGARVNGVMAPLITELNTGDIVEILTQKNKAPSKSWLDFVQTSAAKNAIRKALKGKTKKLIPSLEKSVFKILAKDRMGLLKDLSAAIARSHINITDHQSLQSDSKSQFKTIKITCALSDKNKIEKIVAKLKKVDGVKFVEHRLVP